MIAALKALWKAISWWLKGFLGLRGFPYPLNEALVRVRELDWAVWEKVAQRVFWAVSEGVDAHRNFVFGRVLDSVAEEDPPHPALQDFLREARFES